MSRTMLAALILALVPFCGGAFAASSAEVFAGGTRPEAFRSVQAAIDALPGEGGTVRIAPGTYREKLLVRGSGVTLVGTGRTPQDVVLVYGDSAATTGSTFKSATLSVPGSGFTLRNLTVANDWWMDASHPPSQAIALALTGDRAVVSDVRLLGHQDTLLVNTGVGGTPTRAYFEDCYIAGHVDFIFGNAKAYFRACQLHGEANEYVMYTAQSRNAPNEDSAFIFDRCRLTADPGARNISLGRPWRDYASVVFLQPVLDVDLAPGAFTEWTPGKTNKLPTTRYALYAPSGRGIADLTFIREGIWLDAAGAAEWALDHFFHGDTEWIVLGRHKGAAQS